MKISPQWLREFVDLTVDDHRLAGDLTAAGIAVEGITGDGASTIFEMEIGTNRPDAMNHYGVAREAAALYGVALRAIEPTSAAKAVLSKVSNGTTEVVPSRRASSADSSFAVEIEDGEGCARYTAQIVRRVKIKTSPEKIVARL